ncbi:MAG: metalloprotease family protein [Proteobacteria bacterium]|nr:metalloprotease family protein [Pseudomonadota bacterium]
MIIPKEVVGTLTFPGIVVHEWAHKIFCRIFGVRVLSVKYWSPSGGEVRHEPIKSPRAAFFISFAPLIVNSLVAILCGIGVAAIKYLTLTGHDIGLLKIANFALWYLGVTIGMNAFPSDTDTKNVAELMEVFKKRGLRVLAKLLHYVFKVLNILRFVWVDFLFGILLVLLPTLVMLAANPGVKMEDNIDKIRTEIREFEQDMRADAAKGQIPPKPGDGSRIVSQWGRIDKNTKEQKPIKNPYGGEYLSFLYATNDESEFVITTDKIPMDVCEKMVSEKFGVLSKDPYAANEDYKCAPGENAVVFTFRFYDDTAKQGK